MNKQAKATISILVILSVLVLTSVIYFVSATGGSSSTPIPETEFNKDNYQRIETPNVIFDMPVSATHIWNPSGNDTYEVIINNLSIKGDEDYILKLIWNDQRYVSESLQIHYEFKDGILDKNSIKLYSLSKYNKTCLDSLPNSATINNLAYSSCENIIDNSKLRFLNTTIELGNLEGLRYKIRNNGTDNVNVSYPIYSWSPFSQISVNNDLNITSINTNGYSFGADGAFKISFKNNSNVAEPVLFQKDGYFFIYDISQGQMMWKETPGHPSAESTLGSGLSNSKDTQIKIDENKVNYDNAFSYTNISYSVYDNMLKENYILSNITAGIKDYTYLEYSGKAMFNSSLKICANGICYPDNVNNDFNTSGRIDFKDSSNKTIFYLAAPVAKDSAGNKVNLMYVVHGSNAQMNFWLRIPTSFLRTATYPIFIDPTIVAQNEATIPFDFLAIDDVGVSACGTLNTPNGVYYLTQDIPSTGSCMSFGASNISLNLMGYTLSGDGGANDAGLNMYWQNDNIAFNGTVANFGNNFYGDCYDSTEVNKLSNLIFINGTKSLFQAGGDCKLIVNNVTILNSAEDAISDNTDGAIFNNIIINTTSDAGNDGLIVVTTNLVTGATYTNVNIYSNVAKLISYPYGGAPVTFINSTYNSSGEVIAAGSVLKRQWYYRAFANDTNGNLVSGANITAYNVSTSYNFNLTTDATGYTPQQIILDYINDAGTRTYSSLYNITAVNATYTPSLVSHTFNASLGSNYKDVFTFQGTASDSTYPTFNSYAFSRANNSQYAPPTTLYQFNTTISNTNGTAGIQWAGVNYTLSNSSAVFNKTFSNLAAGTYTYYWWAYGNGTSHLYNVSQTYSYTVAKNSSLTLILNPTTPITYGTSTDFNTHKSGCPAELTCSLNVTDAVFAAGTVSGNYSTAGNANYSAKSTVATVTINKATSAVGLSATTPITYGTSTNFAGTSCPSGATCNLNITNGVFSAGTISANYSFAGNTNYTGSSAVFTVTIDKANPSTLMTITGTTPIIYPTVSAFTSSETNTGDGGCTYSTNRNNGVYGVGTWTFNYSTAGCTNWTAGSVTKDLVVQQNTTYSLGLTATTPITYGTSTNFAGSGCPSGVTCGLNITNGVFSAGTISANYSTAGNTNYSAKSAVYTVTINKAASQTGLIFDKATPQVYGTAITPTCSLITGQGTVSLTNGTSGVAETLGAGTWVINCSYAGNTNYTANSNTTNYVITKAPSIIYTYLNNARNNASVLNNTAIWLNSTLNTGVGTISLYKNGTLINSGTSPLSNYTAFNGTGMYNITSIYAGNTNYTGNSETFWVNVSAIVDSVYPIFSNYSDDTGTLIGVGTGYFNVTVENTNGTVYLNINGVQVQASNTSNIYNATYTFTNSGSYSYNWTAYGNGTLHNLNTSTNQSYVVNPYPPTNPGQTVSIPSGGSSTPTVNNTKSQNFSLIGTPITLSNMSISYNKSMYENTEYYIDVKAFSVDGSLTDVESVKINFSADVKVKLGDIGRISTGNYRIPVSFIGIIPPKADFTVTLIQNEKTISSTGSVDILSNKLQDTWKKVIDFMWTWGILFVIVLIIGIMYIRILRR